MPITTIIYGMILEYHDKDRKHGIQMGEEYIRMLIAYCTFYPLSFALLCRLGSTRPLVLILLDAYVDLEGPC